MPSKCKVLFEIKLVAEKLNLCLYSLLCTTPLIGFASFGAPGVEFYGQLPKDKVICSLHFVPGHVSEYQQIFKNIHQLQ